MTRRLLWTMVIAGGLTVANLYYNQPLLQALGDAFGVHGRRLGLVPMLTLGGYALGMLFITPLGDSTERRRLTLVMTLLSGLALLGVALAPTFTVLAGMFFLVGLCSVIPQLLLPAAANLAEPSQRGRVLGFIMSGLLIGILLSRTLAGFVGAALGWRWMFGLAAGLMVPVAVALRLTLPLQPPEAELGYGALLRSLWELIREEPSLRLHALLGAASFAAFNAFWATLAPVLAQLPAHYGPRTAGAFGVLGLAGALVAPFAGRRADASADRGANVLCLGVIALAFALMWPLGQWLWGLALGVTLLDAGAQGNQITNQARVYALRPNARSRLNTVYMFTYFVGGALGANAGSLGFSLFGRPGVCAAGLTFCFLGLAVLALGARSTSAARAR